MSGSILSACRASLALVALLGLVVAVRAQDAPLTTPTLPRDSHPTTMAVPSDATPQQPAAAQPTLPGAAPPSPVVDQLVERRQTPLTVRKEAIRPAFRQRHMAQRGRHHDRRRDLDRPALAGVELVAPLPPPGEPPHVVVPTPAFPLESFVAAYTTPPPPIVCHPTRRERGAPDPHLYKETPVACVPDNP